MSGPGRAGGGPPVADQTNTDGTNDEQRSGPGDEVPADRLPAAAALARSGLSVGGLRPTRASTVPTATGSVCGSALPLGVIGGKQWRPRRETVPTLRSKRRELFVSMEKRRGSSPAPRPPAAPPWPGGARRPEAPCARHSGPDKIR